MPGMADEIECDGEIARAAHRRSRLAVSPVPRPDWPAEGWLEPDEQLLARSPASVDRRITAARDRPPSGTLYVTSKRLVLTGVTPMWIALGEIQEAAIVGGKLVLLLPDGIGVTITCERPQHLRAQIAAARATTPVPRTPELAQPSPR